MKKPKFIPIDWNLKKIDTLKNLVEWIGRNFVRESRSTNARALYMFANKPGTLVDYDGFDVFSKFNSESEAEQYFNAFENMKFIIESEFCLADSRSAALIASITDWNYNKGNAYKKITETWKITVTTLRVSNIKDSFVVYCPSPYNPRIII